LKCPRLRSPRKTSRARCSSPTCPCRLVAPVVDQLADEYAGRIKVGKIDVDDQPELQAAFDALSIPTLVLVKDGAVVAKAIGARPKAALASALALDEHAVAVA
jgi:thioredoxin 1